MSNNAQITKAKLSKIRVIVRKRPANHREYAQNDIDIISTKNKNTIIVKELKNKFDLTKYIEEHKFTFDRTYDENSSNQLIYNEMLKPMIEAAFNKTKISCFAYGQTGSGKTYTMLGNNHIKNDIGPQVPGLYLLSCIDLFNFLKQRPNLELWVSFYEIYCNKLFDLLNNKNILQAREDGKGNICIVGLLEKQTKNIEELLDIIDFGLNSRTVGITGANLDSSRSHAILQINIKTKEKEIYSKVSFIDLAGSERAVDTIDTNKKTKIDGAEINKSLLALKECIRALDLEKRHKPFRGSKLTLVLRDSFMGNCQTLMIANISPCLSCSEHTLNTLRYADRVKELRKPRHEREREREGENNNMINNLVKNKKTKENDLLLNELLMMPRNNGTNIKYNVEINKNNNIILNHNYNYMKLKHKTSSMNNQDINIQRPDKNVLKIDDVIKNEQRNPKYNFRKSKASSMNKEIDIENYKSKYTNYVIKSDEEYQNISNIHEDLINQILKEEDNFINEHKNHIDNMVQSLKDEMTGLHEVEKPGSNIEQYTDNLDKLLTKEIETIMKLKTKLNKFRVLLKDESALAKLFEEEEIVIGTDDEFEQKSLDSNDIKI